MEMEIENVSSVKRYLLACVIIIVVNGSATLKLSTEAFFVSTYLLCVREAHTIHLGPWGTPSEPKNNYTYPVGAKSCDNSHVTGASHPRGPRGLLGPNEKLHIVCIDVQF